MVCWWPTALGGSGLRQSAAIVTVREPDGRLPGRMYRPEGSWTQTGGYFWCPPVSKHPFPPICFGGPDQVFSLSPLAVKWFENIPQVAVVGAYLRNQYRFEVSPKGTSSGTFQDNLLIFQGSLRK